MLSSYNKDMCMSVLERHVKGKDWEVMFDSEWSDAEAFYHASLEFVKEDEIEKYRKEFEVCLGIKITKEV